MSAAPCGCDLIERAQQEADPRGAAVLVSEGARAQALWRCPRAASPADEGPLSPACERALVGVHRLVGVDTAAGDPPEFTGCPCLDARKPDAHDAVAALMWFRKGQLQLRHPHPSAALCDAIDVLESALSAREADDLRRLRAEHERK